MATTSKRNRLPVALSATALVVALFGAGVPSAVAHGVKHALFAHNADKVDGKHAVSADATATVRARKLIATDGAGHLPNDIITKAPDSELLDGVDSAMFWQQSNDGSGSGLDADTLDGQNSSNFAPANHNHDSSYYTKTQSDGRYLPATGKAQDADRLDGLDSTAFGIKMLKSSGSVYSDECDQVSTWNQCAPIQITVPAGRTYRVLVTAEGTFFEFDTGNMVNFCASVRPSTSTGANCLGEERGVFLRAGDFESMSDSTWATLTAGTWVVSSAVNPSHDLNWHGANPYADKIQTVALVLDASGPQLP